MTNLKWQVVITVKINIKLIGGQNNDIYNKTEKQNPDFESKEKHRS
jgi:hypothetical protein